MWHPGFAGILASLSLCCVQTRVNTFDHSLSRRLYQHAVLACEACTGKDNTAGGAAEA